MAGHSHSANIAHRKGLVDPDMTITMPGGQLRISIDEQGEIRMRGPVEEICSGDLSPDLIRLLRSTA